MTITNVGGVAIAGFILAILISAYIAAVIREARR